MSQLVEVNPNVNVQAPIKIELGSLPLSLGLFAGSGLLFIAKGEVPKGIPKIAATVLALGLAVGGVLNLVMGKSSTAGAATDRGGATPSSAPPEGTVATQPEGFSVSDEQAFSNVTGRIVTPTDFSSVRVGSFAKTFPVRLQLQNNSEVPITFDAELTSEETPGPVGSEQFSSLPIQVSLVANQIKNIDVNMPIAALNSILVVYVDVILTLKKRRGTQGDPELLDLKSFTVR